MCVIAYKPLNVAFPEEATLKNCWDNNPDMAGFMYAWNDHVYIWKGFEKFEDFMKTLNRVREKTGDEIPFVMHFRISTQGFDKACCQPFPLSGNMKNLKRLKVETNIGVAHNGILSLTSDGSKDYSDTMLFTTEYLVNIIRSFDWYKDDRTKKLIENLIEGSRFAILDKKGHCELMGKGWVENKGCYYSNSTYSYPKPSYTGFNYSSSGYSRGLWDDYYDDDGMYQTLGATSICKTVVSMTSPNVTVPSQKKMMTLTASVVQTQKVVPTFGVVSRQLATKTKV